MDIDRIRVLRDVIEGRRTAAEACAELGMSERELSTLVEMVALSRAVSLDAPLPPSRRPSPRTKRFALGLAIATCAFAAISLAEPVLAQVVCNAPAGFPAGLTAFCAGQPARAVEINGNFDTIADWMSTKTGALGSEDIATRDVTARNVTAQNVAASGQLSFGSAVRQMLNLWSTSFGFGVQNSTLYARTSDNFAWFRGGSHNDGAFNAGGGNTQMTLDSSGNLAVRGTITGTNGVYNVRLRDSGCYWTYPESPADGPNNAWHTAVCGAGQYMNGWRCWATSQIDGGCAAYCCNP